MRWVFNAILLIVPIASMILTRCLTYEPVTRLLQMDLEIEARTVLNESRNRLFDAAIIQHELDERKQMLLEDYDDKSQRSGFHRLLNDRNALMIGFICALRFLHILTANLYIFIISATSMHSDMPILMLTLIIVVRIVVFLIPKYSIDKLGRRCLLLASGLGSGIFMIPFAAHQMNYIALRNDLLAIVTFSIQIFAAMGIEPIQHIYACEAFSLSKRNASLAIVACMEYILNAIIVVLMLLEEKYPLEMLLVISPFVILALTIILFATLPETKAMALRRCRDQFNKNKVKIPIPPPLHVPSGIQTLGSVYM